MKRKMTTLIALLFTCILGLFSPVLSREESIPQSSLRVTRVWARNLDPAVSAWLRKQAAVYEKETGKRIYLRTATGEEIQAAQREDPSSILPDLYVCHGAGNPLAYLGYALFIRDESAPLLTPAPTSALFFRPTATPGPSPTPAPAPDFSSVSPILSPDSLSVSLANIEKTSRAYADFSIKKAPAALLTAGQASALSFGYQAYPLPDGEGFEPVSGQAFSPPGQDFLAFLQSLPAQIALKEHGLYAALPGLILYDESDPLRILIERSKQK